jgi:cytidylate kinase
VSQGPLSAGRHDPLSAAIGEKAKAVPGHSFNDGDGLEEAGIIQLEEKFIKLAVTLALRPRCNDYTTRGGQPAFLFEAVGNRLGFNGVPLKPLRQEREPLDSHGSESIPGRSHPSRGFWGWAHWPFGRRARTTEVETPPVPVARFRNIAISREAGAGGGAIARMVATKLNWKVYDHELVEAIAHRMERPVDEVKIFDELAPSAVQDWLLPLREEHYAPQEAYLDHLAKLVEAIGRAGDSIVVGRGAGFILPRNETLSVRIIAPLKARAARLAERMGVSQRTARRAARDLDRRRAQFVRTMYRADANDSHNYDLVLDSDSLGLPMASELITRAVEFGRPEPPPISLLLRSDRDDAVEGA